MAKPGRFGSIGCGNIFKAYAEGSRPFELLELAACADLDLERARAAAEKFGIPKACSVGELLGDDSIELVVNLTVPRAHAEVNLGALEAGKHVYCEKPFALELSEARRVLAEAARRKLLIGCAPDTFLGGGLQTCRKLIDDGAIGTPVAAVAFMASRGPEGWHPNPDFFYQRGGGPMLDMGPYYLTALVHLLGPIQCVSGAVRASFAERVAGAEAIRGKKLPVEVPTHQTGAIEFESGAIATVIMSFDVAAHSLPRLEIYGSEGSMRVPDPNTHGGTVEIKKRGESEWQSQPLTHSDQVARGIGAADLAYALRYGRSLRPSGELAAHVLEAMLAFEQSSAQRKHVSVESRILQPKPLPLGLAPGRLDE